MRHLKYGHGGGWIEKVLQGVRKENNIGIYKEDIYERGKRSGEAEKTARVVDLLNRYSEAKGEEDKTSVAK